MAYRGEDINFTIKGDEKINLDSYDFKLLTYPDGHTDQATTVEKANMTKIASNHYEGQIDYKVTKDMPLGTYTIEILLIESTTERSIYVKRGAYPLYDSASKNIE